MSFLDEAKAKTAERHDDRCAVCTVIGGMPKARQTEVHEACRLAEHELSLFGPHSPHGQRTITYSAIAELLGVAGSSLTKHIQRGHHRGE